MANLDEYAFLVIDTSEGKRSSEDPDFDAQAYEADRLMFINQGMHIVESKSI
ncbi:hypothetical protein [Arthrobacter mobilis]|uniref:Uncharacterized protein n=1 Tax=Arthrobacter mobilis TaxID=2724944 RepID=A0A7X6HG43_9MICC|nr:hypothetical protein [Arthrobacter mobilis]NKX55386.1 hypothetical protein [Arthrobacter mobilis]